MIKQNINQQYWHYSINIWAIWMKGIQNSFFFSFLNFFVVLNYVKIKYLKHTYFLYLCAITGPKITSVSKCPESSLKIYFSIKWIWVSWNNGWFWVRNKMSLKYPVMPERKNVWKTTWLCQKSSGANFK